MEFMGRTAKHSGKITKPMKRFYQNLKLTQV